MLPSTIVYVVDLWVWGADLIYTKAITEFSILKVQLSAINRYSCSYIRILQICNIAIKCMYLNMHMVCGEELLNKH